MSELKNIWPAVRTILSEFTFYDIKKILSASGFNIQNVSHLQQGPSNSTPKGQLLDEVEETLFQEDVEKQNKIVQYCVAEIVKARPDCQDRLEELLVRVGWGLSGSEPFPLKLQLDIEAEKLPEFLKPNFEKAIKRYRDGDVSGAITAICGAVDDITGKIYVANPHLGDHREAAYHERISKSYALSEKSFKEVLKEASFCEKEINTVWDNAKKSVSQAGYVLSSYRRNISDVHGDQNVSPSFIGYVLDSAVFIIHSLSGTYRV